MKKFFIIAVMFVMGMAANAQLVKSRTFSEKESNTMWYMRFGMSMNNAAGQGVENISEWGPDGGAGTKVGYDIAIGFQKPITDIGLYWGMEYGLGTRGAKATFDGGYDGKGKLLAHNVKISPFTFGYKYSFTDDIKLDAHLGAFVSYDYAGKGSIDWEIVKEKDSIGDLEDYQRFDAGMQIGVGVWFNRFNLDFTYQRGFINVSEDDDLIGSNGELGSVYSSNFMIRLGFAF